MSDAVQLAPPVAARRDVVREHHGDQVVDPYEWLRDKESPEVVAHLEAENAYAEAVTAAPGPAARGHLRGDPLAHPGVRPLGAGGQRPVVVLLAHGRG